MKGEAKHPIIKIEESVAQLSTIANLMALAISNISQRVEILVENQKTIVEELAILNSKEKVA